MERNTMLHNRKLISLFLICVVFFGSFLLASVSLAADPCEVSCETPFSLRDKGCPADKPMCEVRTPDDGQKIYCCVPALSSQVVPTVTFSPLTNVATFADLICGITAFISDTLLPPVAVLMMLVVGFMFLTSGGAPQKAAAAQTALLFTAAGVFVLLLAPGIVSLIGDLFGSTSLSSAPACQAITTDTVIGSFINLINWFAWFVAVAAVATGLYSGFLYITARDNPSQTAQAAKTLSYVIIGVAVAVLAFSIVTITKQLTGLG